MKSQRLLLRQQASLVRLFRHRIQRQPSAHPSRGPGEIFPIPGLYDHDHDYNDDENDDDNDVDIKLVAGCPIGTRGRNGREYALRDDKRHNTQ